MGGRRLKNRLMHSAAALPILIASPALAASPGSDWSGFYAGLTAGATWARSHETTNVNCAVASPPGYLCATGAAPADGGAVSAAMTGSFSTTQPTGGVEAGYNWQNGPAVYGVELDLEAFKGAFKSTTAFSTGTGPVSPFS